MESQQQQQPKSQAGEIFKLIPLVMKDVGAIGKNRKVDIQGGAKYAFRGIDDVYNACQDALSKNGVFVVPEVLTTSREERVDHKKDKTLLYTILTIRYTFYGPDGSSVSAVTVGEALDTSDKACNKAMSAAQKYALIQTLCIPTEGDNDTENSDHQVGGRQAVSQPQAKPASESQPPAQNGSRLVDTTGEQFKLMRVLVGKVGLTDRDQILARVSAIVGRQVPSSTSLSVTEVGHVIDVLKKEVELMAESAANVGGQA